MQITVVGGSKGTGRALAEAALDAGHVVTVVTRSGEAPEGARVVRGSATDADVARDAVEGADAVVVTVGGAEGEPRARTKVTEAVIHAMQSSGAKRLVVQSSLGAGDSGKQMPAVLRTLMQLLLRRPLQDHEAQESAVRASGLDWTIVRATGLTDKPATGQWQALTTDQPGTLRGTIARADLAQYLLEVLGDETTVGKAPGVSGR